MIGWYGIPGAPSYRSTLTHADNGEGPICGTRLGKKMKFNWCCQDNSFYDPECKTCKKILKKTKST